MMLISWIDSLRAVSCELLAKISGQGNMLVGGTMGQQEWYIDMHMYNAYPHKAGLQ